MTQAKSDGLQILPEWKTVWNKCTNLLTVINELGI